MIFAMIEHTQEQLIEALKDRFERMDHDQVLDGSAVSISPQMFEARLATIRLAIAGHALDTLETALDQISICFEVSKMMFFYADAIVQNPEFWEEEKWVNRTLASNNFKMAKEDMEFAGNTINQEVLRLQAAQQPVQEEVLVTLDAVNRYQQLVGRFHEAASVLTELDGRQKSGVPLYDADQKPDLRDMSAEAVLKRMHLSSFQNAGTAIRQNVEAASSCMEAFDLLKSQGNSQSSNLEAHIALILNRFEALKDARDNRYGYTQLRFE